MTTYTLQELERLAAEGECENMQECSPTSRDIPPPLPDFRVNIRREIADAVRDAGRALTRAEIAKVVGRKKTTWLNERIEACVAAGLLTRSQSYWKNGVVMYFYCVVGGREA